MVARPLGRNRSSVGKLAGLPLGERGRVSFGGTFARICLLLLRSDQGIVVDGVAKVEELGVDGKRSRMLSSQ